MRTLARLIAVLLVSAAVIGAAGAEAAPRAAVLPVGVVPAPANDPFYVPPVGFGAKANGAILRARQITATSYSAPLPVNAWQVLFKSTDSTGQPTAEVVTVMVPLTAWTGPGERPVVSYQTAEDSVGSACQPSYAIRAGLPAATSNAAPETNLMASLIARGWAVVTTDYEGPQSEFLAGPQEAHGVLDGIRAAMSYDSDGLNHGDPLALWGYSGGAFATASAAEVQPRYAPELSFIGIAIGGTPADLLVSMEQVNGGYGSGLVIGAMIGLERAYPDGGIAQLFTPAGASALASSANDCTDQLLLQYAFKPLSSYTVSADPFANAGLQRLLAANSPIGQGSAAAPVYDYHTTQDELVPVRVDDALVAQYCRAGDTVQRVRYDYGDHNSTLITGAPAVEQFLADRFAGTPAVDSCPSLGLTPTRATPAPQHRVVLFGARGPGQVKPRTVSPAGRSGVKIRLINLRWRHWGAASATATGASAGGAPVRIGASRLRTCGGGNGAVPTVRAYTRLTYTFTRRVPRGLRRRNRAALPCR